MRAAFTSALLMMAMGAAQAGQPAPQRIAINNPALIDSADARQRLKYLASCALAEGVTLHGEHDGARYEFPGAMGIAPHWAERGLNETERRWVSACILSRTNAFGARVLISMRADPAPVESLRPTPDETASHTLYEGGFFGDLFADPPSAYVCVDGGHESRAAARALRKRVCATPAEKDDAVSRCDFILMRSCGPENPPEIDGAPWSEVIHVWLAGDDPQ